MDLYEPRAETGDINLGCTKEMVDALEANGLTPAILQDGTKSFYTVRTQRFSRSGSMTVWN